jgi:protein-S-isoprenylcysteine O-methyltransferase Ste14
MYTDYLIFFSICLIGLVIRSIYELLKKTGKVNQNNKAVFVSVFVAMCMMLLSWLFMCPLDPLRINLPYLVKLLGIGISITGLGIAFGGMIQLRGVENIDHLVISGLFPKLRQPNHSTR